MSDSLAKKLKIVLNRVAFRKRRHCENYESTLPIHHIHVIVRSTSQFICQESRNKSNKLTQRTQRSLHASWWPFVVDAWNI